jgi:hypothetical protein
MKVVLFCGGIGSQYYTRYGHKEFILRFGDKADVLKHYFRNHDLRVSNDLVLAAACKNFELL